MPDTLPGLVSINHNLIGLARVSTDAQDTPAPAGRASPRRVRPGLSREGQYPKGRHGAPGLTAALDYLRPGDTLVVWKLDRLGRSVKEVLTIADDLHARGIAVRILTAKLSGSFFTGRRGQVLLHHDGRLAELERDIIHERTMAGLAAAKAQGRTGGRPTVMDADKLAAARRSEPRPRSPRLSGVSRASVYRHLAAEGE